MMGSLKVDFAQKRPRVEYRLSERGHELLPASLAMRQYSAKHS